MLVTMRLEVTNLEDQVDILSDARLEGIEALQHERDMAMYVSDGCDYHASVGPTA